MAAWVALLLLVVAGLVVMLRPDPGSLAGYDPPDFAVLMAGLALLVFIGSSLAGSYRGRAAEAVRDMLAWAVVALALVIGYSYRDRLLAVGHQVLGELLPPGSVLRADVKVEGEHSAKFRRRPDGTYVVAAEAHGVSLKMLVDTGASWVVLTAEDGRRLGFDLDDLRYTVPVQTANGIIYAASVRLRTLTVGKISINNVDALVAKRGPLRENLLGLSFLNRLSGFDFSNGYLTLRKI
jgi:aspartyl protease family protein